MPTKPPTPLSTAALHDDVQAQAARMRATASSLVRRLPPSVEREDLEQDGFVGLMEAMVRWTRATNGEHFENYVTQRARGAMLDGLRAMDPATRALRSHMREVERAIQQLAHTLGRLPREGEVAQALDEAGLRNRQWACKAASMAQPASKPCDGCAVQKCRLAAQRHARPWEPPAAAM